MPEKLCAEHHRVMYRDSLWRLVGIALTIVVIILGLSFFSFASNDRVDGIQRQLDTQDRIQREFQRSTTNKLDRVLERLSK